MKLEEKILFYYETTQSTDAGGFIVLLSEHLMGVKMKIKKRIVLCALELLQNNLIYNNKNVALIRVAETTSNYILEIKQDMDIMIMDNVINQIKKINEIEVQDLQLLYKDNLLKASTTTGNGHIFCRLKSGNLIDFRIIKHNIFIIKLKFDKI